MAFLTSSINLLSNKPLALTVPDSVIFFISSTIVASVTNVITPDCVSPPAGVAVSPSFGAGAGTYTIFSLPLLHEKNRQLKKNAKIIGKTKKAFIFLSFVTFSLASVFPIQSPLFLPIFRFLA